MDIEDLRTDFEEAVKRACIDRKYHANNLENMVARYPEEGGMYRQMWVDSAWIVWQQLPALIQPMQDRLTAAESEASLLKQTCKRSAESKENLRKHAIERMEINAGLMREINQLRAQLAEKAAPAVNTESTLDFGKIKINYTNMKMEIDNSKDWILPDGFVGFMVKGTGISPTPNTGWHLDRNAQQTTPAESAQVKPQGKNRYGLDAAYFYGKLQIILRDIASYKPDEMARSLARLTLVADEKVLQESEFSPKVEQVSGGGNAVFMHDDIREAIELIYDTCKHVSDLGMFPSDNKELLNLRQIKKISSKLLSLQPSPNKADVPVYRQHRVKYKGHDSWSGWSSIVNDRCDCTKEYFESILKNPVSGSGHTYQVRELYASEPLPPLKDE